jgi:hypothetical protein
MILKLSSVLLLFLAAVIPAFAQQEYFLPQIANGTFSGGSYRMTFVVVNNSDQAATVIIQITDDNGSPMAVTIPGLGTQSTITLVNLAAGASRFLQTDGSGVLKTGAARVTSTAAVTVSAVFAVYDANGNFQTEAGVGSSTPATEFVIPVDTTGDFNTGLAIFSQQAANLTFRLNSLNGQQNGSNATRTLNAGNHLAQFVGGAGQLFPTATGFRGTMVVTSSTPVSALTLRMNTNPLSFTSLPALARNAGKSQIYLSQVANGTFSGGRFKTTFLLFNMAQTAAAGVLTLSRDDGSPFQVTITGLGTSSTFPFNLPAGASVFMETDGLGALSAGAASIVSSAAIGASAIFTILDTQGRFTTEAGVGDSPTMTELTLPVDIGGGLDTGVAFFNPGLSAINMTLTLVNDSGASAGMAESISSTAPLSLGPRTHTARFVSELFPGQSNFRGSLAISSAGGGVSAVTLRQKDVPLNYTTLPSATGMKHFSTPTSGTLLPKTRTGITATSDTTVSDTLPPGFKLSGSIQGSSMAIMVMARASDGTLYSGSVNFLTSRYVVVVPAGTYELTVCHTPQSALGSLISSYKDPTSVQVSADTTRNITLPSVTTFMVSGAVTGLASIPAAISDMILYLTSADNVNQGMLQLETGGAFSGPLPTGSYTASLGVAKIQHTATQTQFMTLYNLGTLTVSGASTTANFAVLPTAKLSGTVRVGGLSTLPSNTSVTAIDLSNTANPNTISCAVVAGVSNVSVDPAGPYQLLMATGRNHTLNVEVPVMQGSTSIGDAWYPTQGLQLTLSGARTQDLTMPAFPGTVAISGKITDGSGQGLANIAVGASTQQVTPSAGVGFSASTKTDSSGNYRLVVLSGVAYTLTFVPPTPQP